MRILWTARPAVTPHDLAAMEGAEAATSLSELARRAIRDEEAREALLARVRDLALRYARVRLGRFGAEDAAQDVAQEVCMAVLSALSTYEERGLPFEAFVYRIASRKLADAQRGTMQGPTLVADLPDRVDEAPGPEAQAVRRSEVDLALRLMSQLSEQHREILTLRVAVGLTADETAAALDMTPGAVRVAQHRALNRLRSMVAEAEAGGVA
jgi:RNA polymerase sigma-70 factor (ECF subfamily)